MVTNVDIQNCIDKCTQSAQMLRDVTNNTVDHRARLALTEAGRHIEMCIHGCLDAKEMAKS